jgi:hypothetical protein
MKLIPILIAVCLVPLAAFSAEPVMSGPLAGYILDPESRSVRPVLGILGSAYVAGAVLDDVDALAVSPDGARALVSQGDSLVLVGRVHNAAFEAVPIEDTAGADKLAWSPDGSAAVAYSSSARAAQVLTGGKSSRVVDLSALEHVSVVAIGNSGESLLIGAEGGLYFAAKGGEVRLIAAIGKPVAIALAGADAFVAAGGVFEIHDYAGQAAVLTFAEEADAVGLQAARDGKRLIVAAARSISVYDVASRTVAARLDLDFTPTMLSRLGSETTFALNSGAAGVEPLYVIDAGREPAVFFVPSGREQ